MKITKALALRAGVALATVAIGAGISAQAADAAGTSTGHSADVKVDKHSTITFGATCPMGQHVDGGWAIDPETGAPTAYIPTVQVSNFWVDRTGEATATDPYTNGFDGLYRGFTINVHNYDLVSSHTSTISWACDAN